MANPRQTATPEQIAAANAAMKDTVYRDFAEYNDDFTMSSIDNGLGRGNTQQAKRRQDDFLITNPLGAPGAYESNNWFEDFMDDVFPAIMVGTVAAGALAVGGSLLFGGAGASGTAAGAASAGGTGAAGAAEAAAGLGGLGSTGAATSLGTTIGASGIPQVIISGAAPAAAGGLGAGGAAAIGGLGLGGLAAATGGAGAAPLAPEPVVDPANVVQVPGVAAEAGLGLGGVAAGIGLGGLGAAALSTNPAALQTLPPVVAGPGAGTGLGVVPPILGAVGDAIGGIGDVLGPLAPWLGAANDYKNSKEDQEFWKGQLDELSGMYKPGTLEAEQMRQKMEARDAASGRRSQYGIREVNLATNLAEKRSGIMTSAGYQNMANAYRNRDSQSLNSLFGAMGGQGQPTGSAGGIGGLLNGIGSTVGAGKNLWDLLKGMGT